MVEGTTLQGAVQISVSSVSGRAAGVGSGLGTPVEIVAGGMLAGSALAVAVEASPGTAAALGIRTSCVVSRSRRILPLIAVRTEEPSGPVPTLKVTLLRP